MSKSRGPPFSLYSGSDNQPSITRLIASRRGGEPLYILGRSLKRAATVWRSTPVFTDTRETFGRWGFSWAFAAAWTKTARSRASTSGLVIPCRIKRGASPSKAACATRNAVAFAESPISPLPRCVSLCAPNTSANAPGSTKLADLLQVPLSNLRCAAAAANLGTLSV